MTERRRGRFITFEGPDGCGKSTQMRLVAARLRERGVEVTENYEPGGTRIGMAIRRVLLEGSHLELSATTELLLFFASRAQAVDERIRPALAAGHVVLSDRFTDSTMAYQGYGRGLGTEAVRTLDAIACRGLKPDLTILLDIAVEEGLARAKDRNREGAATETRLDDESLEFHRRVRNGYLGMAAEEPERFRVIAAGRSVEEVAEDVWRAVE